MYSELALFIDGKWLSGEGRKSEDVINPATGKVLAALPHASMPALPGNCPYTPQEPFL